jgi:outer membrane protein OmpA-like peptidoglycan-associated protein
MRSIHATFFIGASLLAGCASSPEPRELLDARSAYQEAARGPAAELNPAQLHVAHDDLVAAEQSWSNHGDDFETRDRAYIAIRHAQLADAQARGTEYDQKVNLAMHQVETTQAQQAGMLNKTREQLAAEKQALANETVQRQEAEKRANQAMADLARVAAVKQDTRGTVITLAGGVLFASAKYDLLPTAQANLTQVAEALSKSDPDSKITVAGYTDSQGGEAYNMQLSQHRAESVRGYLVSHGVAPDRITAQGFGPAQPVADNASPEGRADNRRVEIVIHPPSH